jgi:hypothetical protein
MELLKANEVRQTTAFQCFLFVALRGNLDKELPRCGPLSELQSGPPARKAPTINQIADIS